MSDSIELKEKESLMNRSQSPMKSSEPKSMSQSSKSQHIKETKNGDKVTSEKKKDYQILIFSCIIFVPLTVAILAATLFIEPFLEYSKLSVSPQCSFEDYEEKLGTFNHTDIYLSYPSFTGSSFTGPSIFHKKFKGTKKSYHKTPTFLSVLYPQSTYTHDDIYTQLKSSKIRALDFDVHYVPTRTINSVYDSIVDLRTHCLCISDCFHYVKKFLDTRDGLLKNDILMIFLRMRVDGDATSSCSNDESFKLLYDEIFATFDVNDVFIPKQLLDGYDSAYDAIIGRGWPNIETTQGKVMFVLEINEGNNECLDVYNKMDEQFLFVGSGKEKVGSIEAVVYEESSDSAIISQLLSENFIVKCFVGESLENLQFCIDSGAQILYTKDSKSDFLKDGAICNTQTSTNCTG